MGEEVRIDDSIAEWEAGLPSLDDLTPLSQSLIPAELASAFKISPEPSRTAVDVTRASQGTLSSLRGGGGNNFKAFVGGGQVDDHVTSELEPEEGSGSGSDSKKTRRTDPVGDDPAIENNCGGDDQSTAAAAAAKTLKRPRLVWTPQLHKRFVDVVAHLGLKNAVPKTIMQLMNVEGLTRENVASHLQKYRLYVKRMQGLSNEAPSPSDQLFASTPVPLQSFNESSSAAGAQVANGSHGNGNSSGNSHAGLPISMPYPSQPQIMPMQLMGHGFHGFDAAAHSHHYQQQQHYNSMVQQQRDWSGNKFNGYCHHVAQNNNKC